MRSGPDMTYTDVILRTGLANAFTAILCRMVYPKVSGLIHKELYAHDNKHSLRSNTKGYGGKTH
jgi:hypothetical protein